MNYLKDKKCYFSGPIEHNQNDYRKIPIQELISRFGLDVFDPASDPKQQWIDNIRDAKNNKEYDKMSEICLKFVRKDLGIVDRTDLLIAYLPQNVATTGTHHEIINAVNSKKIVLLVGDNGKENLPLWYYGFIPHEYMFGNWDDCYNFLKRIDDGEFIKSKKFQFFYGLI